MASKQLNEWLEAGKALADELANKARSNISWRKRDLDGNILPQHWNKNRSVKPSSSLESPEVEETHEIPLQVPSLVCLLPIPPPSQICFCGPSQGFTIIPGKQTVLVTINDKKICAWWSPLNAQHAPDMLAIAVDGNRKHYRFKKSRGTDEPSLCDGLFIAQDSKVSAFVDKIRSQMTIKSGRDVCGPATFTACRETSHKSRAKAGTGQTGPPPSSDKRRHQEPNFSKRYNRRGIQGTALLSFAPSISSGAEN
ncbi:hypothetical protein KUCAC02_030085 [Chaenocephalus aceratus]|uniref:Uncharacterized protein n=1 Tax=Chaenocephalus aceratus TaxID=36190 RepID=A0ACB9XJW8_CHAAC|nr:hypothetical protein KUCAC02_030085 [Chaenocephalus aceratus]